MLFASCRHGSGFKNAVGHFHLVTVFQFAGVEYHHKHPQGGHITLHFNSTKIGRLIQSSKSDAILRRIGDDQGEWHEEMHESSMSQNIKKIPRKKFAFAPILCMHSLLQLASKKPTVPHYTKTLC